MTDLITVIAKVAYSKVVQHIQQRKYGKLTCLVIPSASGKSQLKTLLTAETSAYHVFDIEALCIESMTPAEKTVLLAHKASSVIFYEDMLYRACKEKLKQIREHLCSVSDKKPIVLLISSVAGKRILKVHPKGHYYIPSKALFETILTKVSTPQLKEFVAYTRDSILQHKPQSKVYKTFEELFNLICTDLGVAVKV